MTIDTLVNKQRPAQVLLVEDNYGDVLLTQRAFQQARISNELNVVKNGEDAIAFLKKEGRYENAPMPDIILLDLNLPKIHGHDVLHFIKQNEDIKHIPVIILSSSKAEQDVVKGYSLHANGYVVKPVNLEKFKEVVLSLEKFWFTLVVMPDFAPEDMKHAC